MCHTLRSLICPSSMPSLLHSACLPCSGPGASSAKPSARRNGGTCKQPWPWRARRGSCTCMHGGLPAVSQASIMANQVHDQATTIANLLMAVKPRPWLPPQRQQRLLIRHDGSPPTTKTTTTANAHSLLPAAPSLPLTIGTWLLCCSCPRRHVRGRPRRRQRRQPRRCVGAFSGLARH